MVFGKLRPVGSRVPKPEPSSTMLPWEGKYLHEFTRSGTDALSLAVRLAMADRADVESPEVLIPAYGCPDLVAAVVAQGATPVVVDLADQQTPRMDAESVAAAITSNTVAVIAVDFLGIPERLDALSAICQANNLLLIEDSAQCFPPESVETGVADLVILSFGRGKPINLMGGGALLIRKDHHSRFSPVVSRYSVLPLKIDFFWYLKRFLFNLMLSRVSYVCMEKLPFLHLGETRLHFLGEVHRLDLPKRLVSAGVSEFYSRPVWQRVYDRKLSFLDDCGWVRLHAFCDAQENGAKPRLRYALLAPNGPMRDQIISGLNKAGIAANSFYGRALPDIDGVAECLGGTGSCIAADEFASRLLTLPCHDGVSERDINITVGRFSADLDSTGNYSPPSTG